MIQNIKYLQIFLAHVLWQAVNMYHAAWCGGAGTIKERMEKGCDCAWICILGIHRAKDIYSYLVTKSLCSSLLMCTRMLQEL